MKQISTWLEDKKQNYFDKYIIGQGIDIGCGTSSFHPSAIGYDRLIDPKT